ncbi:MAG TPA: dihydrofolate reductase family protein [Polyangiaceae bacterium]|jgi:dihydrofolate reductase
MSKLTLTTFLTLDGVMQAPGGPPEDTSGGFSHGGWLVPYFDAEMAKFMSEVFERVDAFLLGRGTYEIFAGHWPRVTDPQDPIASRLNRLPKHVVSKTLDRVEWHNSWLVRDVVGEVAELKRRYRGELQVHGSAGLAQTLIEHDLVDEYNLLFFPIVLGSGKRLFGNGAVPAALELQGSRTTNTGVIMASYRRAGRPKYGSFMLDS